MNIIAHQYDNSKYLYIIEILSKVLDIRLWHFQNKSIYDVIDEGVDKIIIPLSLRKLSKSFCDEEIQDKIYWIDDTQLKTKSTFFPKGSFNKKRESDVLILGTEMDDLKQFAFLLYPNQTGLKVKVISATQYPVAEYIGISKKEILVDYIKSAKLVICFNQQVAENLKTMKVQYLLYKEPLSLKEINLMVGFPLIEEQEYNTYCEDAIEILEQLKQYDKIQRIKDYEQECRNYY